MGRRSSTFYSPIFALENNFPFFFGYRMSQMEVCRSTSLVQLIPHPERAPLRICQKDPGRFSLQWAPTPSQDRDTTNATAACQIDIATISELIADEHSASLLILLNDQLASHHVKQTFYVFTGIDCTEDEPFLIFLHSLFADMVVADEEESEPRRHTTALADDPIFSVLETFSKVTNFYRGLFDAVVNGGGDRDRRPGKSNRSSPSSVSPRINPWINSAPLNLPPTRRLQQPEWIPATCPDSIFLLKLFTGGSVEAQRAENWLRLFKISNPDDDLLQLTPDKLINSISEDCKIRIEKDVLRTDRNEPFYYPQAEIGDQDVLRLPHLAALYSVLAGYAAGHPDIDYVQGMNDLASPLLYVFQAKQDLTAKAFAMLMRKQHRYFSLSSSPKESYTQVQLTRLSHMLQATDPQLMDLFTFSSESSNLFIAYRWLLLLFKREVGFDAAPLVLETILSAPTANYELFIALALLLMYRDQLISEGVGHRFDLTLQFYAQRAGHHDVHQLLSLADQLHQYFCTSPTLLKDARFAFIKEDGA